jgi:hypothetical protein
LVCFYSLSFILQKNHFVAIIAVCFAYVNTYYNTCVGDGIIVGLPYRAQTVSYRVLARYLEFLKGITPSLVLKAEGKENAALANFQAFTDDFGKYELEMERNYDHHNLMKSYNRIFKTITVLFDAE